ncbi:MAG TPA: hypothetical protein V6C52_00395 [Coleofasciculaceae cyanobacterium]|jgi:hypothetical protein
MILHQRFYEQEPVVAQAVGLMFLFPEPMQEIIALGLSQIASQECQAHEVMNNVKSLGSEHVLSLYKSKRKRRNYDQNQIIHQAINHLFVLSPENRVFVSHKVIELVGFIQEFLKATNTLPSNANLRTMNQMMEIYVGFGPDESRQFLDALQDQFLRSLGTPLEALAEGDGGLRVWQHDSHR